MAKRRTSAKTLISNAVKKIIKRSKAVLIAKDANLPVMDVGYSQARDLSQHRNGHHVIYKALHALNLLHKRPVSWPEVADLLATAPRCGGYAFFVQRSTIKRYMHGNDYGLWRKLDRRQHIDQGRPRSLFVATGLTTTGQKRADRTRHRGAKIQAVMVW